MSDELQEQVRRLDEKLAALEVVVSQESRLNYDQQQAIAKHINSVAAKQRDSDLPTVFMAGTFITFMVVLASLEVGAEGISFSPRETITKLIAVPGLVGAVATLALPAIQSLLKKYNIESGNIVTLPTDSPRSISD
ncbi:MAG: hypothetical protein WBA57_08745 [Elainellaceae cyanobacterium]